MTASSTVPESVTELFESLAPPCDFVDVTSSLTTGQMTSRTQCKAPAKWIVGFTYECGTAYTLACCDRHHELVIRPVPLFCVPHNRAESIHNITSDVL